MSQATDADTTGVVVAAGTQELDCLLLMLTGNVQHAVSLSFHLRRLSSADSLHFEFFFIIVDK